MEKDIVRHKFIKRAGGISIAALVVAVITVLLPFTPANAAFESQCRLVSPGKCAECHPKNNEGECNLVADHTDRVKAECTNCHADCTDLAAPPFDHFEDVCMACHELNKVHKKHDQAKEDPACASCHSGDKIVIAYDSKRGSTQIYAEQLGDDLCANGYQVDIGRVMDLLEIDLTPYAGVVFGGPTYTGIPLPGLKRFLDANRTELAGKQVAYLYNSLSGGETGNSTPWVFWYFAHFPLLIHYPDIFPLVPCPFGSPAFPGSNLYPFCDTVPYWVGMMPGRYVPRDFFPTDYLAMEVSGFGGEGKDYLRPAAATEFAQTLMACNFFSDNPTTPPTVTVTATPSSADKGEPVQFTATVTDPVGTITYSWDFGDGNTSTEQNPVHTYDCNGTFTAKVQVVDDAQGCPGQASVVVTVNKPAGDPITYECDVQPVLNGFCTSCHGVGASGGLDARTCDSLAQGGKSGPSVIPGDRNASPLYTTIIDGTMPPGGEPPPSLEETETIGAWIDNLPSTCAPSEICNCP